MMSQLGKRGNRSRLNVVFIVIQQRNEQWNGRPNFLAKLDFIPPLAMSE
jgi:hypothetical protein